jgi:2-polyprenyl-3-methyl-5-hydroxy-6-metoxy-1,4-benzoquinol methylase
MDLVQCEKCHCIQKNITPHWKKTVDNIYSEYTVYYQADGSEQLVFINGQPISRSHRIIAAILEQYSLPTNGQLLDIGCGNGSFLRAFHHNRPEWAMCGSELNDHDHEAIESIPGFETLWCCGPDRISGSYDLISMIHVLEHIVSPVSFLKDVKNLLPVNGLLVIETPNYRQNPFDLLVADHSTHFSLDTLSDVVEQAGFEILWKSSTWIPKELTIIAKVTPPIQEPHKYILPFREHDVSTYIDWLEKLRSQAISLANKGQFGIFGTSISATWLFSEMPLQVIFFVDEDPSRIGKTHFGLPIYDPAHIPQNSTVLLPFCSAHVTSLKDRLAKIDKTLKIQTPHIKKKGRN